MKHTIHVVSALVCLVLGGGAAFAQSASMESLIGKENSEELVAQGTVKRIGLKTSLPILAPRDSLGVEIRATMESFEPNLLVEVLYLYKKPGSGGHQPWTAEQRLAVYNTMRSLSTLSGIQYYSASRKTMRTFYETSYAISDPDKQLRIPDPVVTDFEAQPTVYALQTDLTFGKNLYRYDYRAADTALSFTQSNLTTLKYGILPILGVGRLRTTIYVTDLGDDLVVYAVSAAKATLLPGVDNKVRDSFSNRADAIYKWFVGNMDLIYKE